jgi:hypothetical protein
MFCNQHDIRDKPVPEPVRHGGVLGRGVKKAGDGDNSEEPGLREPRCKEDNLDKPEQGNRRHKPGARSQDHEKYKENTVFISSL